MRKLKLISPPTWASTYEKEYEDLTNQEIETIKTEYNNLIEKLNNCIEEYVSEFPDIDNSNAEDQFENYPNFFEMTGEYYISHETYNKDNENIICSYCVELQDRPNAPTASKGDNRDYHGLEVLLIIEKNNAIIIDGVVSSWGS